MTEDVPWLDDNEQRIWRQWIAVGPRLDAALGRQLQRDSGLSHREYEVLVHLSEAPDGQLRMTELAEAMQWERSRLSHQIARMTARGLVERLECPEDRRGVLVTLTEDGRSLLTGAAPGHVRAVRRLFFDAVAREDLEALDRFSAAVLERLAADAASDSRPVRGKEIGHTAYARVP